MVWKPIFPEIFDRIKGEVEGVVEKPLNAIIGEKDRCPYRRDGVRCVFEAAHTGSHYFDNRR